MSIHAFYCYVIVSTSCGFCTKYFQIFYSNRTVENKQLKNQLPNFQSVGRSYVDFYNQTVKTFCSVSFFIKLSQIFYLKLFHTILYEFLFLMLIFLKLPVIKIFTNLRHDVLTNNNKLNLEMLLFCLIFTYFLCPNGFVTNPY